MHGRLFHAIILADWTSYPLDMLKLRTCVCRDLNAASALEENTAPTAILFSDVGDIKEDGIQTCVF